MRSRAPSWHVTGCASASAARMATGRRSCSSGPDRATDAYRRPAAVCCSDVEITERVRNDLVSAMKSGDRERVGTLRMLLSELQKAAKEGSSDELAVLRRERKRRAESERAFRDGGREDLAEAEAAEGRVISAYLPAELEIGR